MICVCLCVCVREASSSAAGNTSLTTATRSWLTHLGLNRTGHTHWNKHTQVFKYSLWSGSQVSEAIFMPSFGMIQLSNLSWWEQTDDDMSQISLTRLWFIFANNEKAKRVTAVHQMHSIFWIGTHEMHQLEVTHASCATHLAASCSFSSMPLQRNCLVNWLSNIPQQFA